MGCTVVICTDGQRSDLLERCINSLLEQTHKEMEILCVSTLESLPEVVMSETRVIIEKRKGVSLAKNIGIRHSTYDLIALTDDDCVCHRDWVENLLSEFKSENVGCVTGGSLPTREGLWHASTAMKATRKVYGKGGVFLPPWSIGAGNNICLRKDVILDVGLFDEELGPGTGYRSAEDIDVFHRIIESGYEIVNTPQAIVDHEPLDSQEQVRKMLYNYRLGMGAFFAKNRSSAELREYFRKVFLRSQLRSSRNNLLKGDVKAGWAFFNGYLGALRGYFDYVLNH